MKIRKTMALDVLVTILLSATVFAAAPAAPAPAVPAAPATTVVTPAPVAPVVPAAPAATVPALAIPLLPVIPAGAAGTAVAAPAATTVPAGTAGTSVASEVPPGMELVPGAVPPPPPAPLPPPKFQVITFWPGAIIQARATGDSVPWLDLDTLLKKGRFNATDEEDTPAIQRPPAEGKQYSILVIKLREKRSIGKYDFVLKVGSDTISCLAMSKDDKPYDQRLWEVVFSSGASEVNLLYEIPAGTAEATLVSALPVTLPQAEAAIHFMTDAALAAAPAASPVPATPAGTGLSLEAASATPAVAASAATVEAAVPAATAVPAPPAGTVK